MLWTTSQHQTLHTGDTRVRWQPGIARLEPCAPPPERRRPCQAGLPEALYTANELWLEIINEIRPWRNENVTLASPGDMIWHLAAPTRLAFWCGMGYKFSARDRREADGLKTSRALLTTKEPTDDTDTPYLSGL